VCNVSSEEHLQPFKDKMEEFLTRGKKHNSKHRPYSDGYCFEDVPFESSMTFVTVCCNYDYVYDYDKFRNFY